MKKICPLSQKDCLEDDCAWYVTNARFSDEGCAIALLSNLEDIGAL